MKVVYIAWLIIIIIMYCCQSSRMASEYNYREKQNGPDVAYVCVCVFVSRVRFYVSCGYMSIGLMVYPQACVKRSCWSYENQSCSASSKIEDKCMFFDLIGWLAGFRLDI